RNPRRCVDCRPSRLGRAHRPARTADAVDNVLRRCVEAMSWFCAYVRGKLAARRVVAALAGGSRMAEGAVLGVGVMGYPMAGHLKNKGGHDLTVYNRTAAKAEKWVAQYGGAYKATPKEAAAGQDFVMCCVGNDNDLREVTLGPNGAFAGIAN